MMESKHMESRQEKERVFWREFANRRPTSDSYLRVDGDFVSYFGSGRYAEGPLLVETIGDLRGKRLLECGSGSGWVSVLFARAGAEVWSFDITREMIERAVRTARVNDLADRIHPEEMSFEDLSYADAFFDVAVGFGVLHHVDLDGARDSLHRVLKPGGLAVFNEPLGHNLPLEFARQYLPYPNKEGHATDIPLKMKDIERFAEPFERYAVTPFYFFSMLEQAIGRPMAKSPLRRLDAAIARRFPWLGRFYRMAMIALYR
jgi:SAM-dependent methyltransferase